MEMGYETKNQEGLIFLLAEVQTVLSLLIISMLTSNVCILHTLQIYFCNCLHLYVYICPIKYVLINWEKKGFNF